MKTYREKLLDPRWQRQRLEILNRADFACEECHAADKTLHVHHKRYRQNADPWEYPEYELQALCEDCHDTITMLQREIGYTVMFMNFAELFEWLEDGRLIRIR